MWNFIISRTVRYVSLKLFWHSKNLYIVDYQSIYKYGIHMDSIAMTVSKEIILFSYWLALYLSCQYSVSTMSFILSLHSYIHVRPVFHIVYVQKLGTCPQCGALLMLSFLHLQSHTYSYLTNSENLLLAKKILHIFNLSIYILHIPSFRFFNQWFSQLKCSLFFFFYLYIHSFINLHTNTVPLM